MIEILSTGRMSSVQDPGRFGHRSHGVSVAGALDALALAGGNALLGNAPDAAGIEVLLFPLRLRFHVPLHIALTGADCAATLDGTPLWPWWTHSVRPGQELVLHAPARGAAAYLCVAGGIDVPVVLGSRSTDLKAGFGGLHGRVLRKGDRLAAAGASEGRPDFGVQPPQLALPGPPAPDGATVLRVLPAAEHALFGPDMLERLWTTRWAVTPQSNRIGYRLAGPALQPLQPTELLSHGIVPGVIQVPPSGQPIVMQCDAQTSGGYPKIGTVIEADQWRLAQTRIGGALRFVPVDAAQALDAWRARQRYLGAVQRAARMLTP
ncbi:biotin-dependent carboxyltransferase family protein [Pseudorhodoferax sp. LjRoot39]|uniref:5-oxoprolinase subunit C family protein n=1 Tax=Pseudorhodoferax sp. LjRoot39 TaxID=3342328 RepID=UPI003ECE8954